MLAKRLSSRRRSGQLTIAPPGTYRDPITTSASRGRRDQRRQVTRIVRQVGVHLADDVDRLADRLLDAVDVRAAEAARARAVHDLDAARDAARASASATSPVPSGD